MNANENSATGPLAEVKVENTYKGKIDYPRSFYFSREVLEKFDNFKRRLLLATPHRFREHYCDASLTMEIAALRDLERMDRESVPSVVAQYLREHIVDHYEN